MILAILLVLILKQAFSAKLYKFKKIKLYRVGILHIETVMDTDIATRFLRITEIRRH